MLNLVRNPKDKFSHDVDHILPGCEQDYKKTFMSVSLKDRFSHHEALFMNIYYDNQADYASSCSQVNSTVIIQSFQTDRSGQTVHTQIRLLLYSLIRVFTVSIPFTSF